MIKIRHVIKTEPAIESALSELLIDAVHNGASVGFLAPLPKEIAENYWQKVFAALGDGLALWVAESDGKLVGSVQLDRCQKQNGRHRAEIQKLFVLKAFRGQSISSKLMAAAENFAHNDQRTLLVLDTLAGTFAETVYQHLGWQKAGEIPQYAATPDGVLQATVYYYKLLVS
jgi:acetyltransferase